MLDMMLKFVPEFLHRRINGAAGCIPQGAKGAHIDAGGKALDQVQISMGALAVFDAVKDFFEPVAAFAARGALAAAFVGVKAGEAQHHFDDAGAFIHDDHAAAASHGASGLHLIKVHGAVKVLFIQHGRAAASRDDGLDFAARAGSPGKIVDQKTQGGAHGEFVQAGPFDMAGNAENTSSGVIGRTDLGVFATAHAQNRRNSSEGFDVIDGRWLAKSPFDRREGWLDARFAATTL